MRKASPTPDSVETDSELVEFLQDKVREQEELIEELLEFRETNETWKYEIESRAHDVVEEGIQRTHDEWVGESMRAFIQRDAFLGEDQRAFIDAVVRQGQQTTYQHQHSFLDRQMRTVDMIRRPRGEPMFEIAKKVIEELPNAIHIDRMETVDGRFCTYRVSVGLNFMLHHG